MKAKNGGTIVEFKFEVPADKMDLFTNYIGDAKRILEGKEPKFTVSSPKEISEGEKIMSVLKNYDEYSCSNVHTAMRVLSEMNPKDRDELYMSLSTNMPHQNSEMENLMLKVMNDKALSLPY